MAKKREEYHMTRINGKTISLRELSWDDQMEIRQWATDPDTTRWLGNAYLRPQTFEQTQSWLRSHLDGDVAGLHYAIADRATDRYVGQIDLIRMDTQARHGEMAIVLCPDSQNRDIGKEAIRLLLSCAFETWNLHRVYLRVDADNVRAIACYRSCGFREEGRMRDDRYWGGRYHDTVCMGILREEWHTAYVCSGGMAE